MSKIIDMTGKRYGRLIVIGRHGSSKDGLATWICKCDCGRDCVVEGAKLRKGNTRSCGCLHDEKARQRRLSHGQSGTRLYAVWKTMVQRCRNPANKNYDRYGGRGIDICDEWARDYQLFHDWAMNNGYDPNAPVQKCTIDRIDNDKGYCPANCRWVDMKVQNNNRSNRRMCDA